MMSKPSQVFTSLLQAFYKSFTGLYWSLQVFIGLLNDINLIDNYQIHQQLNKIRRHATGVHFLIALLQGNSARDSWQFSVALGQFLG